MDFKKELENMETRMFTPELTRAIMMEYQEKRENRTEYYCGYERTIVALYKQFDHDERKLLRDMERYLGGGMDSVLRCGFRQGIFKAFHHLYTNDIPETLADDLEAENEPGKLDERLEGMIQELAKGSGERELELRVLKDIWDDRKDEIRLCGFYMGYRYAFDIIKKNEPERIKEQMVERIFRREIDLEF